MFKIGVIIDSFCLAFIDGIKKAKEVGASGIQIYATSGEMAPENITQKKRREILDIIKSNGLVVSALCGDLGGHGFAVREENRWKIEKSKRIMELAKDLETDIITTHIGVIPQNSMTQRWEVLYQACTILGEFGSSLGAKFAIETGPENADTLKSFLDSLNTKGVAVNYDPANLVMVTGDDPVAGVYTLKDYIVHTHAKDGIMLKRTNPEIIYNHFANGGIEDINLSEYFVETSLGEGQVDFDNYLKALKDIGYNGFLTVERELGDNPEGDIKRSVEFLNQRNLVI